MDQDKKLEQQFKEFQELAKENKNIDVAALMLNAVANQNKNLVSSRQKKWAYLVSVGFPPFGLLFALKFYFSGEDDAKSVANICVLLTLVSLILFWAIAKMIFSGAGVSLEQIQKITPKDIQQLNQ